jgi:hypothetical protein
MSAMLQDKYRVLKRKAKTMPRSASASDTSLEPIRLDWKHKERKVVVCPADEDRFVRTVEEIIQAAKAHGTNERTRLRLQLQPLFNELGGWASAHASKISHAFLTLRDSNLLFLVVMKGKAYDEALESDLTDLELKIAHDDCFDTTPMLSVLAIPHCSAEDYGAFLNPALRYTYKGLHVK